MHRSALERFDRKHSAEPKFTPSPVIVFRSEIERSRRPGEDANVGTELPQTRQVALVAKLGPTMAGIEKRGRQADSGAADRRGTHVLILLASNPGGQPGARRSDLARWPAARPQGACNNPRKPKRVWHHRIHRSAPAIEPRRADPTGRCHGGCNPASRTGCTGCVGVLGTRHRRGRGRSITRKRGLRGEPVQRTARLPGRVRGVRCRGGQGWEIASRRCSPLASHTWPSSVGCLDRGETL
jgi:hypothetical protein